MSIDLPSILDVAIGVVLLLLLLALIVSSINEVLAKIFSWRAENLKEGITNLLSDPDAKALAGLVYGHPLIRSLGRAGTKTKPSDPSYIPGKRFAQALTDSIRETAALPPSRAGATRDGVVLQRSGGGQPSAHGNQRAPMAAAGGRAFPSTNISAGVPNIGATIEEIHALIATMPDNETKKALLALAERAVGRLDEFEQNVAEWFDDSMDRVSGWYKRKVQKVMFALALALVFLLNANVFEFANALWTQPQLRAAVVAQAAEFRTATTGQGGVAQQPGAERVIKEFEKLETKAGLPLGWDMKKIGLFLSRDRETWGAAFLGLPAAIIGWLLTATAVSLGAPFWFNLLNQILDIRGSGGRPSNPSGTSGGSQSGTAGTDGKARQ